MFPVSSKSLSWFWTAKRAKLLLGLKRKVGGAIHSGRFGLGERSRRHRVWFKRRVSMFERLCGETEVSLESWRVGEGNVKWHNHGPH